MDMAVELDLLGQSCCWTMVLICADNMTPASRRVMPVKRSSRSSTTTPLSRLARSCKSRFDMRIHKSRRLSSSRPRLLANSDRRNTNLPHSPGVKADCHRLVQLHTRHRAAMNLSSILVPARTFQSKASAGHSLRCVTFQVATCLAASQAQMPPRNRLSKSMSPKVGRVRSARRRTLPMPSQLGLAALPLPPMVTVPLIPLLLLPELNRVDATHTVASLSFEPSIYSMLDLYTTIT